MPELLRRHVPLSLQIPKLEPVVLSKRSWVIAFELQSGFQITWKGSNSVAVTPPRCRSVARTLSFDIDNQENGLPPVFSASPVAPVPVVEHIVRHSARNSAKRDGFRPEPVVPTATRPKKRARKQQEKAAAASDASEEDSAHQENAEEVFPQTPIHVMQAVGVQLGIDPSKLTKEKLEAAPSSARVSTLPDD